MSDQFTSVESDAADDPRKMTSQPSDLPDAPSSEGRAATIVCWTLILVSTAVSTARLMQARPLQSANDRSRWCTVRVLVEQGTYRIDDVRRQSGWDTIDLVRHEGHFYSTKPPLFPTIVAGIYWAVVQTTGWNFETHLAETTRLILVLINILPMAVALAVLSHLLAGLTTSARTRIAVMTVACFGTLLIPFLSSLNNHTPAAACVVFALAPAIRIVVQGKREWWRFAAAGFFSACAFTNELTAAALVAVHLTWNRNSPRWKRTEYGIDAASVDWKKFLGNAPVQPFDEYRFRNWRWFWDFGGGIFTDLMVHWIDVAHWILGADQPAVAASIGDHFKSEGVWETPDTVQTLLRYPDRQAQAYFEGTFCNARNRAMIEFMGTKGTIYIDRGRYEVHPDPKQDLEPSELILGTESRGADFFANPNGEVMHLENWVACCRSRETPAAPAEAGVSAAAAAHLANQSLRDGEIAAWGDGGVE